MNFQKTVMKKMKNLSKEISDDFDFNQDNLIEDNKNIEVQDGQD